MANIKIRQIGTNALSCEPLIVRCANGELLCVCQCGGTYEPAPENRVYAFHSADDGETWSKKESIYPEDGQAVYCTELTVFGDEITAYLTVHSGRFIDWKCFMMKSFDNGYTWKNFGTPPHFPEYTFIRPTLVKKNGDILTPYQYYPVTKEEHDRVKFEEDAPKKFIGTNTQTPYCESGVLYSTDGGKTYERYMSCRMDMSDGWIWSEPTVAELSDGSVSMLMRKNRTGWLYRCDSPDGGKTWGDYYQTDIPNPSNKPRLVPLDNGRIALFHTPSETLGKRFPFEMWISDDDMKTWSQKVRLTDFPGSYSYSDGFYEDGHVHLVIEHNRHTILYFDIELD